MEIDGRVVASLAGGQTVELPVESGNHSLHVTSMRFLSSPEMPFVAVEGQVTGFSCRARPGHPFFVQRSLFWLLVSLFKHNVWIGVTAEGTEDERPAESAVRVPAARAEALRAKMNVPAPAFPSANGPPALAVNQLTKRFGSRTAFSEVSFDVAYGEVFGFLGPNGAGKTTTVRTLGTLIAPTSGSATVAGIPLTPDNEVEVRQSISVMPEAPGLYLRLTVTENLEYFAGLYGLKNVGTRIDEALEAVNLGDRAGDLCGGLSKGLRQRVGLARSLMCDPKIMFLDEPTSGLDPLAAREVHDLIIALRKKGVTIFLTTHRLDEAEKLCDRVAILNTTLRTIGTPGELRERLFQKALLVKTLTPLSDPAAVFTGVGGVENWHSDVPGSYEIAVSDPNVAAPGVARSLVAAGADVLSIKEAQHSLEDVYLELISEDVEARKQ
jgi:ABC-2 type transport system ATP-binding protein